MSSVMVFTEIAKLLSGESVDGKSLSEREKRILALVESGFENRARLALIDLITLSETLRCERISGPLKRALNEIKSLSVNNHDFVQRDHCGGQSG